MDITVLRGFCQKCDEMKEFPWPEKRFCPMGGDCQWIGFLSPKQMRIVYESKEYEDYYEKNLNLLRPLTVADFHAMFLEKEPFLVAKILSTSHSTEEGVKE